VAKMIEARESTKVASDDNRGGREAPAFGDLVEALSLIMVARGDTLAVESAFDWKGATMEPFISMQANGFRKWRARVEWNAGTPNARVVEIHFWTDGTVRSHFKIK